ncbi:MAG: hypothetical protein KDB90_10980 [Planctomycetes bacterium]|nr:hypothetical protein [Planctomycetota bacterium]
MLRRAALSLVAIAGILAMQMASVAQVAPAPVPVPAPAPVPSEDEGTALRIAYPSNESPSLDPHAIRDPLSFRIVATIYETLYMYVPGDKPRLAPCLAKDFPKISEDGLTVTIKIDTTAKFHPSTCFGDERTRTIKASDVVHSFKRLAVYGDNGMYWMAVGLIKGLDEYASKARYNMEYETTDTEVEGLRAVDSETLELRLTRPCAPLISLLAHPSFSIIPREAIDTYAGDLRTRAVGTGPYRLNAVADEQLYVLKRWADFRGDKPAFERVTFTVRSFWNEFLQGYKGGELHEMPLWPAYYDKVAKDGKPAGDLADTQTEIISEDEQGYYFLSFNMDDPVWGALDDDGRALRRAVSLCMNRTDLLVNAGWDTKWASAQQDVYPTGMEFENTGRELEFGKYDAKLAKKTLDGCKYKGGLDPTTGKSLKLTFLTTDASFYDQIVNNLRDGLKQLGIKLDVQYVDGNDYREKVNTSKEQMFTAGWFLDYPDPENFLQLFWSGNAANGLEFNNTARYKSDEFDKLFMEYENLTPNDQNQLRRSELTAAMAREIAKDQPIIPLVRRREARVRTTKVEWPSMPRQTYNDIRFVKGKK